MRPHLARVATLMSLRLTPLPNTNAVLIKKIPTVLIVGILGLLRKNYDVKFSTIAKSKLPVASWLVPTQVSTSAPDLAVTPSSLKKLSANTTLLIC
jgi:hypothetical protein